MLMSEPYMKNEMVFVVNGSSDVASQADLAGKNIAVQNGSTAQAVSYTHLMLMSMVSITSSK